MNEPTCQLTGFRIPLECHCDYNAETGEHRHLVEIRRKS